MDFVNNVLKKYVPVLQLSSPDRNDPKKETSEPNKENIFLSDVKINDEHNIINDSTLRGEDTDWSKETKKFANPDIPCVDINLIEHSIDTAVQPINNCPSPAVLEKYQLFELSNSVINEYSSDNEEYLTSEFDTSGHKPESDNTVYDLVIFCPETTKPLAPGKQSQVESVEVDLTDVTCFVDNYNAKTQILSNQGECVNVAENIEPPIPISDIRSVVEIEKHLLSDADGDAYTETPQKYVLKSSLDGEIVNQLNIECPFVENTFEKSYVDQLNTETEYTKDRPTTTENPLVETFSGNNIINVAKSILDNQLENEFILKKNELNDYVVDSTTNNTSQSVHDLPNPNHLSSQEQTHDGNDINDSLCESLDTSPESNPELTDLQLPNSDHTDIPSTANNDSVYLNRDSERIVKYNSLVESARLNCTEEIINENSVLLDFKDENSGLNQHFSGKVSSKSVIPSETNSLQIENDEYDSVKSDDTFSSFTIAVQESGILINKTTPIQSPSGLLREVIYTDVELVQNSVKIAQSAIEKKTCEEVTGEAEPEHHIPNVLNKQLNIMAEINDKLQQENSDLKLELNAINQAKTTLELEIGKKDEIILKTQAESLKKEQSFQHDLKLLREQLKEKSSIIERGATRDLEVALKESQAKEAAAVSDLNARINDDLDYRKIMEEYEKTLGARVTDCLKLKEENETATRHLANLELSFSDLHQKYERAKIIIFGFKKNEETLRQDTSILEESIRKQEERYESLKAHAKAQIEKCNKEIVQYRDKLEGEISKLNAIVKRLEIKSASLETSLEQKTRECIAIAALCDEVTGKKV